MYKYNPDSYLLYGTAKSPRPCFPIRIRVMMTETVRGDVLDRAAQRAIKRYPYFAVRVEVDREGGYVLQHHELPIVVCRTRKKTPSLGAAEVNGHLCFIDYEGCDIYFNIHHGLSPHIHPQLPPGARCREDCLHHQRPVQEEPAGRGVAESITKRA